MSNPWTESIAPVIAALELSASEHPELLPWVVDVLGHSLSRPALLQLAEVWNVEPEQLGPLALKAARDLDRLSAHRGAWRSAAQVLQDPHLSALYAFAVERSRRCGTEAQRQRLVRIIRILAADLETERRNRRIDRLIADVVGAARARRPVPVDEL